jgi:hypothetical protein
VRRSQAGLAYALAYALALSQKRSGSNPQLLALGNFMFIFGFLSM